MSSICKRAWYTYRLMFSGYFIGAMILAAILWFVTINIENWYFAEASIPTFIAIYTVAMPLLTIILTANAFAEELEEMTFPLLWTYPVNKPLLVLERLLLVVLLVVLYMGATFWSIHLWVVELAWKDIGLILKAALPIHLYLAGITLLCSLIGRNMLIGLGGGAIYWLIEMVTLGSWTKGFFLFQAVWLIEGYDPLMQAWWILSGAALSIILCMILFKLGRHWIAKSK